MDAMKTMKGVCEWLEIRNFASPSPGSTYNPHQDREYSSPDVPVFLSISPSSGSRKACLGALAIMQ